ncbi:class A beta-lactamase, subclass A2 [Dyadobacter psychrotolerans]|uniref:beta-lactamase n=1 Tax=Dyadobacter psychrotolerans TaxID=2541721 RepID=A0A4R5DX30_9BACT|nr:class A beta-lactamase, subclass A2 [Dyadobacter psychrotolerans]TDE18457.1 class A beta-lactamase, subclass A2 [Dyadobacter psychrotolerans]
MCRIFAKQFFRTVVILIGFFPTVSIAQKAEFAKKIETISKEARGVVGVGIMDLKSRETMVLNPSHKFPMQSVFKFPLAMAALDQVDKGKFILSQKIHVTRQDVSPKTWSPLSKKYPEGEVDVTLAELLSYTVSMSDNNACDILFRLLGGPKNVEDYIRTLGVKDIAIAATEEEMSKDWNVQFTNWSRPAAMLQLLDVFFKGKKLSKESNDFLWKIMTETTTGPNRMRGLLPKEARVAHKTGTSGTNEKGITAASNDVGIMTLPDGKQIAVVVYVSNAAADEKTRDAVIAQITKAAWDYYSVK